MSASISDSGASYGLLQQINIKVARESNDIAKQQGEAAVSLMEAAAEVAQQAVQDTQSSSGPIAPGRIDLIG